MDDRRVAVHQFFALHDGPFNAHFAQLFVVFAFDKLFYQRFGQVNVEGLWQAGQLRECRNRFQAGDDRYLDVGGAATFHEIKEFAVVEKHLGDDVFGACLNLFL